MVAHGFAASDQTATTSSPTEAGPEGRARVLLAMARHAEAEALADEGRALALDVGNPKLILEGQGGVALLS